MDQHKHPYAIYKSVPEDINALEALPAGAVRDISFYDSEVKSRRDMTMVASKGLIFTLSNPELLDTIARHLMVYVHKEFDNGGDYIVRNPIFDKSKHVFGIPPASAFLVPYNSQGKPHHIFEIESISRGDHFKLQANLGSIGIVVHSPMHKKTIEQMNDNQDGRLNDLLRVYAEVLKSKVPKKEHIAPIWWPFSDIPYRPCTDC